MPEMKVPEKWKKNFTISRRFRQTSKFSSYGGFEIKVNSKAKSAQKTMSKIHCEKFPENYLVFLMQISSRIHSLAIGF
jgi:hypothetical protein